MLDPVSAVTAWPSFAETAAGDFHLQIVTLTSLQPDLTGGHEASVIHFLERLQGHETHLERVWQQKLQHLFSSSFPYHVT